MCLGVWVMSKKRERFIRDHKLFDVIEVVNSEDFKKMSDEMDTAVDKVVDNAVLEKRHEGFLFYLHGLFLHGENESLHAEAIRDEMEHSWYDLSEGSRSYLNKLSAVLYDVAGKIKRCPACGCVDLVDHRYWVVEQTNSISCGYCKHSWTERTK